MGGGARLAAQGLLAAVLASASAGSLLADWRDEMKVLRIGYFSSAADQASDGARLEPFRAYLEARIGVPVELVPAASYAALIDSQTTGGVQYAINTATSFAVANAACQCIEPLALPAAADGSTGYYAILLARAYGPIASLADARGARLALSGEDSIAGSRLPLRAFATAGIDPAAHFSSITTAAGPQAALLALLAGEVDLAVGWSSLSGDPATGYAFGVLTRMVLEDALSMDDVRIVWQSRLIPFGPHAVRRDIGPEAKAILADALFAMADEAPEALDAVDRSGWGGGGFVVVDAGAYGEIAELVEAR
jgi:phosphonate transport system substrate-binding protein